MFMGKKQNCEIECNGFNSQIMGSNCESFFTYTFMKPRILQKKELAYASYDPWSVYYSNIYNNGSNEWNKFFEISLYTQRNPKVSANHVTIFWNLKYTS